MGLADWARIDRGCPNRSKRIVSSIVISDRLKLVPDGDDR
jgi:hypothetical protein